MSAILELLRNITGGIVAWFSGYTSKKNTEARVIQNEKDKLDELNKELQKTDTKEGLDAIRRRLGP